MNLRQDADTMIRHVLARVQPDAAVKEALARQELTGPVTLVAIGKACATRSVRSNRQASTDGPNQRRICSRVADPPFPSDTPTIVQQIQVLPAGA